MAAPPSKKSDSSDFDPSQLLAHHEQHEKHISSLTERVAKIEGHLCTPQAVATFFKESAKDSRTLDGVFAEMFCRFMEENEEVKAAIKKKMGELDRNYFLKAFKRLWLPLYSGILIIATVVAKDLTQWLLSLIPNK